MRIAIGSDHAGFRYKEMLRGVLRSRGDEVRDFGTSSEDPVDYPAFAQLVAEAVATGSYERGIVLGGSGNGEAIVANRVPGVRCSLCWNVESARLARAHNDANVLALGERLVPSKEALAILDVWLTTRFDAGRHARRIALIDAQQGHELPIAERTGLLLNGALIALGAMGILDNVVIHWWLRLHRAVPGPHAFAAEVVLIIASAAILGLGMWRERVARRNK
jgi:ribose 5-phosphate isomerase B